MILLILWGDGLCSLVRMFHLHNYPMKFSTGGYTKSCLTNLISVRFQASTEIDLGLYETLIKTSSCSKRKEGGGSSLKKFIPI